MSNPEFHPASFRDPAGFVFTSNGKIYRQVNQSYSTQYNQLKDSGLLATLQKQKQLIAHTELNKNLTGTADWSNTLIPEPLPFISYPYEWSFDALKDAALLTLSITRTAIDHGMILKDASAYNVQFYQGKPLFIDTLSFDHYDSTKPWAAYRQFCQHFLFPLYLEHYLGTGAIKLLSNHIDGIPVETTARLLPWKSKWNLGVRLHVLLQNNIRVRPETSSRPIVFSKQKLLNLLNHLGSIIKSLRPGYPRQTTWSNYYEETILGKEYLQQKELTLLRICNNLQYESLIDLGANEGYFTRALAKGKNAIAADSDRRCINRLYQLTKEQNITNITPVVIDLSNPSPAIGFDNSERESFGQRAKADLVLALALVHHLAIGGNLPLPKLAKWFARFGPQLIIEFVPKDDEKVKQLLSTREDIFTSYNQDSFEQAFLPYFSIETRELVAGTTRVLYHMKRKY